MTKPRQHRPTVSIDVWQDGPFVYLDWTEYTAKLAGAMKSKRAHRRVRIRYDERLSTPQLTVLAGRMSAYVLASSRGHQFVPRHLPWQEVGSTEWSVPPGGGEGGANRPGEAGMTEGTI